MKKNPTEYSVVLKREQIELNPLNNWSNGDMKDLMESIKNFDLIVPLSIIGPMENNCYRLISGERRFKCLCAIMDETQESMDIPCFLVGDKNMSEQMQSILIETANLESREIDIQTLNVHRANIMEHLFAMVEKGDLHESEIASKAAESFKTSDKYARYWKRIFSSGVESLKEMVKTGDLGIKNAAKIATFAPEAQEQAISAIKQTKDVEAGKSINNNAGNNSKASAMTIKEIIHNLDKEEKIESIEEALQPESNSSTITEDDIMFDVYDMDTENQENVINKETPQKQTPTKSVIPELSKKSSFDVSELDNIDPFDIDIDQIMEEDGFSVDSIPGDYSHNVKKENACYAEDNYSEKLKMITLWCREIIKKDELNDEEWSVVEACKDVVDCFM